MKSEGKRSALGAHRVVEEIFVGEADAFGKWGRGGPAEAGGLAHVEELAGCAVGLGGIPLDAAFVADGRRDKLGQLAYGELLARTGVDGLVAGVAVHEEHAKLGEVVDIEELTQRRAVAPACHDWLAREFRFMEAADERGEDVGVRGVVVVVRAVEVGGHDGDVVSAVLAVEELAVLQSGDLCERIRLVGLLQL